MIRPLAKPNKRDPKPRKAIPKVGKVTKEWLEVVRPEWIKQNPPDYAGNYSCYYCGNPVHISEMTLEHIENRSLRPDLRFDPANFGNPAHSLCNQYKRAMPIGFL